ncbi:MAG TPA: metallophosphoesterase [Flavipsychrobacter sp.]|nr:metallophosphoesterase [Flavipsychrobacter sp.]
MQNRRSFIRQTLLGSGLLALHNFPFESLAAIQSQKLTILHTNDVHSRLEPFPMDGGKFEGQGGVAVRAALIEKIRKEEQHVLLLDAGDIFQGTPYFNLYKGEPEIMAMSMMQYDAVTMGNHDFDAGVEGFARQLPHARFPVLTANYDFTETALEGKTQPYAIFKKGALKVGVFGIGIQLKGLVPEDAYGKTKYIEPLQTAKSVSAHLKKKEKCDLVICLSHLGYSYNFNKVSDMILAKETEYIDLIIGGHTHTFLDQPTVMKNKIGKEIVINQVGWAGLRLGRLDYSFDSKKSSSLVNAQSVILTKQTSS